MDSCQQVIRKTLMCPNCSTDSDYKNHLTQIVLNLWLQFILHFKLQRVIVKITCTILPGTLIYNLSPVQRNSPSRKSTSFLKQLARFTMAR